MESTIDTDQKTNIARSAPSTVKNFLDENFLLQSNTAQSFTMSMQSRCLL